MRSFLSVLVCLICCFDCFGVTGYDKPIETFVIPHSHMDVGWVYTIQVGKSVSLFILIILQLFINKNH